MLKTAIALALGTLIAAPVAAQDMPGAVDLGALSRTQVQSSMADGYAERGGARSSSRNGLSPSAQRHCDNAPTYRAKYGAGHPKVKELMALCRQAGYRY